MFRFNNNIIYLLLFVIQSFRWDRIFTIVFVFFSSINLPLSIMILPIIWIIFTFVVSILIVLILPIVVLFLPFHVYFLRSLHNININLTSIISLVYLSFLNWLLILMGIIMPPLSIHKLFNIWIIKLTFLLVHHGILKHRYSFGYMISCFAISPHHNCHPFFKDHIGLHCFFNLFGLAKNHFVFFRLVVDVTCHSNHLFFSCCE